MQDPIIVCGQTIGVDSYLGTAEQGEIVKVALINFGHILKDGTPQCKRFSFDAFADEIERCYCTSNTPTADVVATLRAVQKLQ
ncbi:hypothetical protein DENIT_20105 [Pseudomonas veronii]|uniref:hypothetical protein n=1 Tax=Pseudomonas veronii TaxID=76761 RepID=UPI001751815F|nr:hypothetical protein [Pseudomonas veronii]CAD0264218.1 hypothetical protein DENIT_20105 [Pseudomonas veronii]